ncbi:MAG: hypothetical protein GJV46_16535 [Geobacter sp.]|nr:hypothetical protein [Geobacter sp.]
MKMSDDVKRKSLAWLAKQPEAMRIEVFRTAMRIRRESLNRLRALPDADHRNTPEIEEQSLLSAIQEMRKTRLKSSDALEEIAASRAAVAKNSNCKPSPKRDRLQILMPQIVQLRKTGMSYAEIARLLSKQTRKKISRSYVHAICKESESAG